MIDTDKLRKQATCVYLAAEASVADDLSKSLWWAAQRIDELEGKCVVCPQCGIASYHPKDIEHGYCGRCKQFHEFMQQPNEREKHA